MSEPAAPKPIFIVGYPRSGTTLVHHTLMGTGEFPPLSLETHYFSHFAGRYGRLSNAENRERLIAGIRESEWWPELGLTDAELSNIVANAAPGYGAVFRGLMTRFAARHGKRAWVEKTPWHIAQLHRILPEFPNAAFILVVRDPRDVALSLVNWKWAKSVNRALIGWVWHMRRFEADARRLGARYLEVRYEDFVGDIATQLRRIGDFVGMSLRPPDETRPAFGVLAGGNSSFGELSEGVSKSAVGRWRKSMSERQRQEAAQIVGGYLERYGYDRAADGGPPLPRKLVLAGLEQAYAGVQGVRRLRRRSS